MATKRSIRGREARVVALMKWLASEDVQAFELVESCVEKIAAISRRRVSVTDERS